MGIGATYYSGVVEERLHLTTKYISENANPEKSGDAKPKGLKISRAY